MFNFFKRKSEDKDMCTERLLRFSDNPAYSKAQLEEAYKEMYNAGNKKYSKNVMGLPSGRGFEQEHFAILIQFTTGGHVFSELISQYEPKRLRYHGLQGDDHEQDVMHTIEQQYMMMNKHNYIENYLPRPWVEYTVQTRKVHTGSEWFPARFTFRYNTHELTITKLEEELYEKSTGGTVSGTEYVADIIADWWYHRNAVERLPLGSKSTDIFYARSKEEVKHKVVGVLTALEKVEVKSTRTEYDVTIVTSSGMEEFS
jgi:hypothetical protein